MAYSDMGLKNYRHKNNYQNANNNKINERNNIQFQGFNNFNNFGDMVDFERSITKYNIGKDDEKYNEENNGESNRNNFDGNSDDDYNVNYEDIQFKGLPFRPQSSSKKKINNSRNVFELLQENDKPLRIKSFEENSNYADVDESMGLITNSLNTFDQVINDTSRITSWLFDKIYYTSQDPNIMINGLGLVNLSAVMYFISNGKTEMDISEFFGFNEKRELNAGLLTIRDKIIPYRNQISFDNYLICDSRFPINTKLSHSLKKLIFTIILNKSDMKYESKRINHMINSLSGLDYEDLISIRTLTKCELGIYSIMKIKPIWNIPLKSIQMGVFQPDYSNDKYEMEYLDFGSCELKAYDDPEISMVEIPIVKPKGQSPFSIGICKSKTNKNVSSFLDFKKLSSCIRYLKSSNFESVIIPRLQTMTKIRLNKTLYKNGLNSVFDDPKFDSMFPEGIRLNDIVQYSSIDFTTSSTKKKIKSCHSTRRFICNQSFIYYLRNEEINLILMIGKF